MDSTQAPVSGVDIILRKGLREVVAEKLTDNEGRVVFHLVDSPPTLEVAARKLGYTQASQYLALSQTDSANVLLRIGKIVRTLDTVRVTAAMTTRQARLSIDAEAIAESPRQVLDGIDVVGKLRPDMVYGLGGRMVCPPAANIWVNGVRIRGTTGTFLAQEKRRELRQPKFHPPPPVAAFGEDVVAVLSTIKAEHIESMSMHDCMDSSTGAVGSSGAIFVVLKPGIAYKYGLGSIVVGMQRRDSAAKEVVVWPDQSHIARLIGLFDAATGEPVVGATVRDDATGRFATSSETGTVSLGFVQGTEVTLTIAKTGYASDTMVVKVGPKDTVPITVLMRREH